MLELFIPEPRRVEIDHVDVAAPPEVAYARILDFDFAQSPLVRALFSVRTAASSDEPTREAGSLRIRDLLDQNAGFGELAVVPGRGVAIGAIGRFWKLDIPFATWTPETFAEFDEPGWGRIAWSLETVPWGDGSRVTLELRLDATDEESWKRFRRYYRVIRPFSHFIRRRGLMTLARALGTGVAALDEIELPGDERIVRPRGQLTHHVDIEAEPAAIWPWLLQMGCGRGGWYAIDALDNDGVLSARSIEPDLQKLRVGDVLPATPDGDDGFTVLSLEPERSLVLGGLFDVDEQHSVPFETRPAPRRFWQTTWAFVLIPLDDQNTRLVVRARVDFEPETLGFRNLWIRPVHHFMERAQLRNLKLRAEGRLLPPHDTWRDVGEGIVGAAGMVLDLFTPFARSHRNHWGLDEAVANRDYPGDDLVPEPKWSWTHGVEIDAEPERVWPWIAQVGRDKAGFYSYQWLENLAGCHVQNADRVHPEWVDVKLGDALKLHPSMEGMSVVDVEPGRWFVVRARFDPRTGTWPVHGGRPERFVELSWLFFLEPLEGGRSRFISRFRSDYSRDLGTRLTYGPTMTESVGFVMDRKMLLGLKARVEAEQR